MFVQYVWLESSLIKYSSDCTPEPSVLIHEKIMRDERQAMRRNLTMKVSTNLAKAFLGDTSSSGSSKKDSNSTQPRSEVGRLDQFGTSLEMDR